MYLDEETLILLIAIPSILLLSSVGFKVCYDMYKEEQELLNSYNKRLKRANKIVPPYS